MAYQYSKEYQLGIDYYMDGNVARWYSNTRVPPLDLLEVFYKRGELTIEQVAMSNAVRTEETLAFLEEYARNQPKEPSEEERYEARAAFGPGVEIVNVITRPEICVMSEITQEKVRQTIVGEIDYMIKNLQELKQYADHPNTIKVGMANVARSASEICYLAGRARGLED